MQGSRDNMSIVIVTFQNAPEISEDALSKEKELDVLLEEKVKGENLMHNFHFQQYMFLCISLCPHHSGYAFIIKLCVNCIHGPEKEPPKIAIDCNVKACSMLQI